jgi:hypothetical protein
MYTECLFPRELIECSRFLYRGLVATVISKKISGFFALGYLLWTHVTDWLSYMMMACFLAYCAFMAYSGWQRIQWGKGKMAAAYGQFLLIVHLIPIDAGALVQDAKGDERLQEVHHR